jgi:hypothetical protein
VALVVSNLIVIFVTATFEHALRGLQHSSTNADLANLMAVGIFTLVATLGAIALSLWGLGEWLMRLTAFAMLLATERGTVNDPDIREALNKTAERKGYLFKLWLVASLYLLLPVMPLSFIIGMKTTFGDPKHLVFDPAVVPPPAWLVDEQIGVGVTIAIVVLTLVTVLYTYVTIVLSAVSDLPAVRTANIAFRESLKNGVPLLVITAIILLANVAVTAPQMLIRLTPWGALCQTPLAETCAQIWLGITSLFVWPLSLAPYCRLIQRVDQTN